MRKWLIKTLPRSNVFSDETQLYPKIQWMNFGLRNG